MTLQEKEFRSLLEHEANCVKNLLAALKDENAMLRKLSHEKISESTQRKIEKIKALEESAAKCMLWIKKTSPDGINTSVRQYIQQLFPTNKHLIILLDEVKTMSEECQRLNEVNGGVIALSQQYTQRALSILHGDTPGSKIYSAQGTAQQSYSPKSLGKV